MRFPERRYSIIEYPVTATEHGYLRIKTLKAYLPRSCTETHGDRKPEELMRGEMLFSGYQHCDLYRIDHQAETSEIIVKGQAGHIIEQINDNDEREGIAIGEFFVLRKLFENFFRGRTD